MGMKPIFFRAGDKLLNVATAIWQHCQKRNRKTWLQQPMNT